MSNNDESILESCFPGPIDIRKYEYIFVSNDDHDDDERSMLSAGSLSSRPPEKVIPYFLNPFILPNAGIYLSYFNVGIAMYILQAPLSYYLISYLDVDATQYSAFATIAQLPWSLKFLLGILSDGVPILGYRRKSWMIVGWVLYVLFCFNLARTGGPSFITTTILVFLMTCAYLIADVAHDALCVERSRLEFEEIKGSYQTGAYSIRSYGAVIGAVIGSLLFNTQYWGWGLTIAQMFALCGLIPAITMLPSLWHLEEIKSKRGAPHVSEILGDIWDTLQLRAVWYPMIFIYTFYVMQIPNAAWTNFLIQGLNFSDFQIGSLSIGAAVLFWAGMVVFKQLFFDASWRLIFLTAAAVNFVFSIGQVLLINRWNVALGIPDIVFALGDSGIVAFMAGFSNMPVCIMFMMLCPEGSEGVTYALLSTISNVASAVSYDIGTGLTLFFDIDNDTLQAGDFSGILYLTLLTSFLQLVPLVLLRFLPDTREEQRALRDSGIRSKVGGGILLGVFIVSLVGTLALNVVWIFTAQSDTEVTA